MKLLFAVCLIGSVLAVDWDEWTKLDEYVQSDDGYYGYEEWVHYEYPNVDLYVINMTSQNWMGEEFSDHPVWWHIMSIAIPHELRYEDAGLLAITGGSNRLPMEPPGPQSLENLMAVYFANETGTVTGIMSQVPNQPIVFSNDPSGRGRSEDAQIAWTWRTFIDFLLDEDIDEDDIDETMITRFPMTKAAKRGLDAIADVAKEKAGLDITRFGVGGASKRGWTTWSLAATDQRVIACYPLVMSLLNIRETMMEHFMAMDGAYSFALKDYFYEDLTPFLTDPVADPLFQYEDMYTYKERLVTLPRLVISATGDEFFLLSDSHNWYKDMDEDMWFMMNPNAEHTLFPHYIAIYNNIAAFWISVLDGLPIPEVDWSMEETEDGGIVRLFTDTEPLNVIGFRAETLDNTTRRDFRLASGTPGDVNLQPVWWGRRNVTELEVEEGYGFELYQDKVDDEWVGMFIQARFEGPEGFEFRFTSEVLIVPETFPHPPCEGEDCYGSLV